MGIILVFSVDDRESFNSIAVWMKQIKSFAVENIPVILVCNKADLTKRQVSEKEAMALAEEYKVDLILASCKDNINIDEIIHRMYDKVDQSEMTTSNSLNVNKKMSFQKTKSKSVMLLNFPTQGRGCSC